MAANDAATPEQAAELRRLVAVVAADWPADEQTAALAVALADPVSALTCFRALAQDRQATPEPVIDSGMRTCRQCANLAPSGRCLAAWRGENFGAGNAVSRRYESSAADWPQRCGAYAPNPSDPDRRSGRERWPFLLDLSEAN